MTDDEHSDPILEALLRAGQRLRARHERAAIEQFEQDLADSPPTTPSSAPPLPMFVHPFYRHEDRMWLVDWLNDEAHPSGNHVRLPAPEPATRIWAADEVDISTEQKCLLLTRQRAYGFAPYVGRPFVYTWNAASDQYGRWVAGERRIAYLDGQP